jgi:hypothetical protein
MAAGAGKDGWDAVLWHGVSGEVSPVTLRH